MAVAIRVELYQFEYLRVGHLKNPPALSVDICDTRFNGVLRSVVGRAVCGLIIERVADGIPVFIVKNNSEYLGGKQLPFIVVNSDEPEQTARIIRALEEYFTEEVRVLVVRLAPFNEL